MDELPICNYEGSDYQAWFWDTGGRGYEDASEATALRRLMPPGGGRRLLELGAGAGRNTPRYRGFEQIVLLDYSLTQLQQARQRLGDQLPGGAGLVYVAANIYHLPFGGQVFDAATMIRTLHHMVDPCLALRQTAEALRPGASLILEYANKRNLSAIARRLLRRQSWSPFSRETREYARLSYHFHPAAVTGWLRENAFRVERTLPVSYLRSGLIKRTVPLGLLAAVDSLAQLTGFLGVYSPSVFLRARLQPGEGAAPAEDPGLVFRCPACACAPLPDTPPELTCPQCGKRYPVVDGIYDLRPISPEEQPGKAALRWTGSPSLLSKR